MELLDIVEEKGGEQQVDNDRCGGYGVPDDTVPWEREKLLMDESRMDKECRLAHRGAELQWEGEQGVGNALDERHNSVLSLHSPLGLKTYGAYSWAIIRPFPPEA